MRGRLSRPLQAGILILTLLEYHIVAACLTISPDKVDFGSDAVNSSGPSATITLSNGTGTTIQLNEIISSGIDFRASNDCDDALAPGARCSIQVQFKPVIAGERMGIVEILASDSPTPYFVSLTGTGR
ncbi:MAG: choice-of-anchor D domain-containing protein [Acidobacteria bacterium]|nr:choice-of-anchor D domain-containing protein [Acidobacteriota bacterium]MBV9624517.1 choice-of-anchor D domain-containing protein [Acidobacteriota bacterium]